MCQFVIVLYHVLILWAGWMAELKAGVPHVRALERGLALLAAFTPDRPQLGLSELAGLASLDKNTARRLLQTLMFSGFVFYDEAGQTYALTTRVLGLASAVHAGAELRAAGDSVLRDVASRTGATSFLWAHDGGLALCVARVRMALPDGEAVWFSVGGRASLNAGAGPRVLLAFLDDAARRQALSLPLERRTPRAEHEPKRLEQQAAQIRKRGWDLAADDFVIGLAGLGVPIRSPSGVLLGALSISTVSTAFGDAKTPAHLPVLLQAAQTIAGRLLPPGGG